MTAKSPLISRTAPHFPPPIKSPIRERQCQICLEFLEETAENFHYSNKALGTLDYRCKACKHLQRIAFKDTQAALTYAALRAPAHSPHSPEHAHRQDA